MKKLFSIAAFLLASTAAQAQYTFEYGGHTIRIDPDRGTVSIPGVYDNSGPKTKRSRADQGNDRQRKQAPQQTKAEPQVPAAASDAAQATQPPAPVTPSSAEPSTATATTAPAETMTSTGATTTPSVPSAPPPQGLPDATAVAKPEPTPLVATVSPALPAPQPTAPPPNSPLGLWLTEQKEGKVRIEQCGASLCGYSVDAKSDQNGEQVLINMKPGKDSKWSGRILDPNTGSTYDSTIALKGSDTLRVQGCAFGGMFCGGQTWTRLN